MKELWDNEGYGKGLQHAAYAVALGFLIAGCADIKHNGTFFAIVLIALSIGGVIWYRIRNSDEV